MEDPRLSEVLESLQLRHYHYLLDVTNMASLMRSYKEYCGMIKL